MTGTLFAPLRGQAATESNRRSTALPPSTPLTTCGANGIGDHYELRTDGGAETTRLYYYAGSQQIAVGENGAPFWLLSDHLGSTSLVTTSDGVLSAEFHYKAFGETRYASGIAPTDYRYTGQRAEDLLGLYFYRARWYDPALGRFIQADTIVPGVGDPLAFDRFSYALGNPVRNTDPSGHGLPVPLIDGLYGPGVNPRHIEDTPGGMPGNVTRAIEWVLGKEWIGLALMNLGDPSYSDWLSDKYGGCFKCHAAKASGEVALTNDQLAQADRNMREWQAMGYTFLLLAAGGTGAVGLSVDLVGYASTAGGLCAAANCPEAARRGITVLGKFPSYLSVARDVGGRAFNIPSGVWNGLTRAQQWLVNKAFLDQAVARGDVFYLASGWKDAVQGSFFRQELEYLFSLGYTISTYQNYLVPPGGW